ncbi:MAG: phospho-N-acetylmuramoyl-pentapeptide-transferase [Candidatus Aenigmarchaeota archaeon]|nr:phospho-N-acetylmuramoyl-pentapeptide-transferase [Candidatus Aenigmarchaeota archaeon]
MYLYYISKIFFLSTLSFIIAIVCTPLLTHFLYKYKLNKRIRDKKSAPIYHRLHQQKEGTPTSGGMLIWIVTLFLALLFFFLDQIQAIDFLNQFNFLTRQQTFVPLGVMLLAGVVGLIDDWLNIKGVGKHGGGIGIITKLVLYSLLAVIIAAWLYFKLDWDLFHVPFFGNIHLHWIYFPVVVLAVVSTAFATNEIDGLDGLAGGTLLVAFAAYGIIAFSQGKFDLACFCGVISGALLSFLWFNIYPARFFMGDTGSMSLGITLGVIATLTNNIALLLIICFPMVIDTLSVIIQVTSKVLFKKKVFLSTPLHHHLQAIGWPEPKIVMRFWIISGVTAMLGLIIFFIDRLI